jgi:hypothetical protein
MKSVSPSRLTLSDGSDDEGVHPCFRGNTLDDRSVWLSGTRDRKPEKLVIRGIEGCRGQLGDFSSFHEDDNS